MRDAKTLDPSGYSRNKDSLQRVELFLCVCVLQCACMCAFAHLHVYVGVYIQVIKYLWVFCIPIETRSRHRVSSTALHQISQDRVSHYTWNSLGIIG